MGFATLRRDGFVSVTDSGECTKHINPVNHYVIAEPSRGILLTRPLIWEPHLGHLFVNAEIRRGGFLSVELVDGTSSHDEPKVLAGFGGMESAIGGLASGSVVAADFSSTRASVDWGSAANLSSVAGNLVRIRFRLSAANLFSFWVSDSVCGASRGDVGAGGPGTEGGRDMHGSCAPPTPLKTDEGVVGSLPQGDSHLQPTDSFALEFGAPVKMPLFCPQHICKYGGSTAADSFHSFAGTATGNVIGSVNRSVVWSSDSGASFSVLPGGISKEGLAQSAVGPGLPYVNGSELYTVGGATLNQSLHPGVAVGSKRSVWSASESQPAQLATWKLHRTVLEENLTWILPPHLIDICLLSEYSGQPIEVGGGVWVKTVVTSSNCSKPPAGRGWGVTNPADLQLFESRDGQRWTWRSLVVDGKTTGGAEGANENTIAVLDDHSLLVIFRVDGGDGWPAHTHHPFMKVRSYDSGKSFSAPEALPSHVLSARPQLLKISGGPLLLSGGRPHLMMWAAADGVGDDWGGSFNLAGKHNEKEPEPALRFCEAFANGTSTWLQSTCYTSLQRVKDDAEGRARALVCYDNLGTEAPSAPVRCQPKKVQTFCMQVTIK